MIISYSRPALSWTLVNATAVTDLDRMTNGRPTSKVRLLVDDTFTITGSAVGGFSPKLCGLESVSLDIGTSVTCAFKRASDGGYTYESKTYTVKEADDGSRHVWFAYPDGLDDVVGVQFTITMGDLGSPPEAYVDIGELWVGPGATLNSLQTQSNRSARYSRQQTSGYGQPYPVRRNAGSVHTIEVLPTDYNGAYVDTNNFRHIRSQIENYETCVVVSIPATPYQNAVQIDDEVVNRHAALGFMSSSGVDIGVDQAHFKMQLEFTQVPRTV